MVTNPSWQLSGHLWFNGTKVKRPEYLVYVHPDGRIKLIGYASRKIRSTYPNSYSFHERCTEPGMYKFVQKPMR